MKINVLKLGTVCQDRATELNGTLTNWLMDMGGHILYLFQPQGLNPDTGQPVDRLSLELERLETTPDMFEEVDVPAEILGTIVADNASGFIGTAVAFVRHINGCFHVVIQPKGTLPKTGSPIRKAEFDLRQCIGEKIIELKEAALAKSRQENPSPNGGQFDELFPHTETSILD